MLFAYLLYVYFYISTADGLPKLLQHCDYVCNVLPSTKATRGLLSGEILKHCQKKVIYKNAWSTRFRESIVILKTVYIHVL